MDRPPALHGVRVLDLSRVLAGPFCTQALADLGATVWKLEPPWGDDTRRWGPPFAGTESAYYLALNRGKNSLVLDLRTTEGQRITRSLAAEADVLVENYKVGDLARYGLDYDRLASINPGLIYISITGFGQAGPRAANPGYDVILQAMTGVMGSNGEAAGPPLKVGTPVVDIMTGMVAAQAALAGLVERNNSGLGQHLDVSLFDVGLMAQPNAAQSYLLDGTISPRVGSGHPQIVPYQSFMTQTGWMVIAVGNDQQYERFCSVLDAPELSTDERFATNDRRVVNRAELVPFLEAVIRDWSRDELIDALLAVNVPAAPIWDVGQALSDTHAEARDQVWRVPHPELGEIPLVASALRHASATPAAATKAPPLLGADTGGVLMDVLGMTAGELEDLQRSGVIVDHARNVSDNSNGIT